MAPAERLSTVSSPFMVFIMVPYHNTPEKSDIFLAFLYRFFAIMQFYKTYTYRYYILVKMNRSLIRYQSTNAKYE